MFQKGHQDAFFNLKALAPRPISTATEIYETDFEEDNSDIEEEEEEEEEYSPRISLNSVRRRIHFSLAAINIFEGWPEK
jgi:hypothetical protein